MPRPNYDVLYKTAFHPFQRIGESAAPKYEILRTSKWREIVPACLDRETQSTFNIGDDEYDSKKATALCVGCPLLYECLEREVLYDQSEGMQAATSARARKRLRKIVGKQGTINTLAGLSPDSELRNHFFDALSVVAGVVATGEIKIPEALEMLDDVHARHSTSAA